MELQNWFDVKEFAPDTYMITEAQRFSSFLVIGSTKTLLIDTGLGIADIRQLVRSMTSLEIELILTHTHWDHLGGVSKFEKAGVHPKEAAQVTAQIDPSRTQQFVKNYDTSIRPFPIGFNPATYAILPGRETYPVKEGDVIDLGDRKLTVYDTPGHSPGGISLLDDREGVLFSGDMVKPLSPLYAHLPGANVQEYAQSMEKYATLAPKVKQIVSSHTEPYSDSSILKEMADGFKAVLSGKKEYREVDSPWGKVKEYPFERFSIWTN